MPFLNLSNWLIGVTSGYMPSGSIPVETVASTIAVSSFMNVIGGLDKLPKRALSAPAMATIGATFVYGAIFFVGHQVGSTIRRVVDEPSSKHRAE